MGKMTGLQIIFTLLLLLVIFLVIFWVVRQKISVYAKQKKELQMYKLYVKPLEDFINDIRAKQHEFDNHLNAILNMHLTITNYEELVKAQSDYMRAFITSRDNSYLGLLRISNKVLAGFLYSKFKSIPDYIELEVMIGSKEIFTNVPEMDLVEVIGTMIDNAVQACDEEHSKMKVYLTSNNDKLVFIVKNQYEKVPISMLSHFFERGYSTKAGEHNQGLGLYNAKKIIKRWNGEIFVENEEIANQNYLSFHVEL